MPDLKASIRSIPDFPKPGIMFRDITPLLLDPAAFAAAVAGLADAFRDAKPTAVVAVEARGFIFGAAVAQALGVGFVPARKPGKLPYETVSVSYALEYGTDTLEMHKDAVGPEDRVLIVDDLLATGGTVAACAELVSRMGARVIGCAFVIELAFLNGRAKLGDLPAKSLITYDSE
jgi:adenine phosphoribosyltransferase